MIELTFDEVVSLAKEIVAEVGDSYSYINREGLDVTRLHGSCSYVHTDESLNLDTATPGCIVGQILHRAGVTIEQLALGDDYLSGMDSLGSDKLIGLLEVRDLLEVDRAAKDFLQTIQLIQDSGMFWSVAVSRALGDV